MRHREERARTKSTLDLVLDLISQSLNASRLDKLFFAHLVQSFLEIGDSQHASELEDRVGVCR